MNAVISETRPGDPATPLPSTPRRVLPSVVVVGSYFLIGAAAFWPVYEISEHPFSTTGDYMLSVWFLAWVPHALAHLLNPFFSNAIFVPTGVNLAQNTASPLLGLVTAPFAPVLDPVARTNLLMVLSMPLSATAAFVVFRKWQVWLPAAALGGLLYGFSPYMVGQSLAHVVFIFVPLPPFIALTMASILQQQGSPRRLGIQLGLLATVQYLISPEVLTTVAIFAVAAVVCIAVRHPAKATDLARTMVVPVGVALAVCAVALTYPVWMMLLGPQHFNGTTIDTVNPFHNDLLSFVAPGPAQKISLGLRSIGDRLAGTTDNVEADGYIGVPVLILTAVLAWRSRRSPRMQLTVVLLVGAALLSLGPNLAVNGRLTGVPLPFLVLDHLPLVDNILPVRIDFEVGAFLAAVVAFGLDDVHRAPVPADRISVRQLKLRRRSIAVLTGVTLVVLVVTQLPRWPNATSPAAVLPAAIRRAIPAGDPIALSYPYDTLYSMQPMLWQSEDGYSFRLLGGYAYHPGSKGQANAAAAPMNPPGLQRFLVGDLITVYGPPPHLGPGLVTATRVTLARYDVRVVIVDGSAGQGGPVTELFDAALGPPRVSAGPFSLWTDWSGRAGNLVPPTPRVEVLLPANGARLSGTKVLDAAPVNDPGMVKLEFLLSGPTRSETPIAVARGSLVGWFARWDTTSVANGTYTLRGVAYDADGATTESPGTTVTVRNR
ncbi:MAG: hypothetical protein ACRDYE_03225 [Acidimicrobiales bacterium]